MGFRGKSFGVNLNFTGYTPWARQTRYFKSTALVKAAQELGIEVTAKDPQTNEHDIQKSRCRCYSNGRYPQVRSLANALATHLFSSTGSCAMKTAVALVACLAGANAFIGTPVAKVSSKSSLQMSVFDDYVGAVDFRGKKFEFDPVSRMEYNPFNEKLIGVLVSSFHYSSGCVQLLGL